MRSTAASLKTARKNMLQHLKSELNSGLKEVQAAVGTDGGNAGNMLRTPCPLRSWRGRTGSARKRKDEFVTVYLWRPATDKWTYGKRCPFYDFCRLRLLLMFSLCSNMSWFCLPLLANCLYLMILALDGSIYSILCTKMQPHSRSIILWFCQLGLKRSTIDAVSCVF